MKKRIANIIFASGIVCALVTPLLFARGRFVDEHSFLVHFGRALLNVVPTTHDHPPSFLPSDSGYCFNAGGPRARGSIRIDVVGREANATSVRVAQDALAMGRRLSAALQVCANERPTTKSQFTTPHNGEKLYVVLDTSSSANCVRYVATDATLPNYDVFALALDVQGLRPCQSPLPAWHQSVLVALYQTLSPGLRTKHRVTETEFLSYFAALQSPRGAPLHDHLSARGVPSVTIGASNREPAIRATSLLLWGFNQAHERPHHSFGTWVPMRERLFVDGNDLQLQWYFAPLASWIALSGAIRSIPRLLQGCVFLCAILMAILWCELSLGVATSIGAISSLVVSLMHPTGSVAAAVVRSHLMFAVAALDPLVASAAVPVFCVSGFRASMTGPKAWLVQGLFVLLGYAWLCGVVHSSFYGNVVGFAVGAALPPL